MLDDDLLVLRAAQASDREAEEEAEPVGARWVVFLLEGIEIEHDVLAVDGDEATVGSLERERDHAQGLVRVHGGRAEPTPQVDPRAIHHAAAARERRLESLVERAHHTGDADLRALGGRRIENGTFAQGAARTPALHDPFAGREGCGSEDGGDDTQPGYVGHATVYFFLGSKTAVLAGSFVRATIVSAVFIAGAYRKVRWVMAKPPRKTPKHTLDRKKLRQVEASSVAGNRQFQQAATQKGAIVVDDAIRDPEDLTEDQRLLDTPTHGDFRREEAWRVMRITSEIVEGIDKLGNLERGVSIFGSARTPENHRHYKAARKTAALLASAGFSIITGGGPGIMQAANRGARDAKGRSIGCNIELPFEQAANPYKIGRAHV